MRRPVGIFKASPIRDMTLYHLMIACQRTERQPDTQAAKDIVTLREQEQFSL